LIPITAVLSAVREDVPYGRNRLARRRSNSEPSDLVVTDPHPCSKKKKS